MSYFLPSCSNSESISASTYVPRRFNSKQVCLTCARCRYVFVLPSHPDRLAPLQDVQQSALIGANVFKLSLQLSGRVILAVVTANGCITTGSGQRPRGSRRASWGGGSPARTPHGSRDIISPY